MIDAKWSLEKILSLCDDDSCDISVTDEVINQYNSKVIKYITDGVPVIMWDHIRRKNIRNNTGISIACSNSLHNVIEAADQGKKWAFQCEF